MPRRRCAVSCSTPVRNITASAADLTRTWAAHGDNDFAHLIKDVNDEQQALISTMKAGTSYIDYHIQFHQRIAKLLRKTPVGYRHERRGDGGE